MILRGSCARRAASAARALIALLVAGCEPGAPALGPVGQALLGESWPRRLEVGDELLVAGSTDGETCRIVKTRETGLVVRLEDLEVRCGAFSEPAGRLRRFPLRDGEPLEPFLERPDLALWDTVASACQPVERRATGDGTEVLVRACRDGDGWPMLALAARVPSDRRVIAGVVLPPLVPVIERLLALGEPAATLRAGGRLSPLAELARATDPAGRPLRIEQIVDQRRLAAVGRAFNHAGRFAEAVRAYERALGLLREGQGAEAPATVPLLAALGLNLAADGRRADARAAFDRAEQLLDRSPGHDRRARHLLYRAAFERTEGELDRARALALEAVTLRERDYGADSPQAAQARAVLGGVLLAAGETAAARRLLEEALAVLERERDRVGQTFLHARLAELERQADAPVPARRHARIAIRQAQALFGDDPTRIALLVELGRIERAAGRAAEARAVLAEAARLAEAVLPEGYRHPPEAAEVHLDLLLKAAGASGPERAAALAEAWRVAQLLRPPQIELAERRMAARLAADTPELAVRLQELQASEEELQATRLALGRLELEDAAAPVAGSEAALLAHAREIETRRASLERAIQASFPRYGAIAAPRIVPVEEAAALLGPEEAMLRLVSTPRASFALALRSDGRLAGHGAGPGRAELAEAVGRLRAGLGFARGPAPFDRATARALYGALLEPLDPALADADHWILVPDGPLLGLPPGVLVVADGPGPRWLAGERALSLLPAVASLVRARRELRPSRAPEPFLGIGDPRLSGSGAARGALAAAAESCREAGAVDPRLLRALPPLPETALELRRVARALGSDSHAVRLGGAASESALRQLALDRYRVISFATHAILPGELRCAAEPALVLTPPTVPVAAEDGLLDASEIARLRLDADWVALSACNTAVAGRGSAPGEGGEALGGLAEAFLHAGARRVLASHWEVDSDATVALMTTTFARFAEAQGEGAARAHREAQRRLMADPRFAHPAYWAAFTLLGDGGPALLGPRARP